MKKYSFYMENIGLAMRSRADIAWRIWSKQSAAWKAERIASYVS